MSNYSLQVNNLTKFFGRRLIFNNLNFNFTDKGIFGISGPNGSGKSTLVKILAGIIGASKGEVKHFYEGKELITEKIHNHIGFASPYLILYEEFSAEENLIMFSKIRGVSYEKERVDYLFEKFLLQKRKNDFVKTYSSGMKQRLKFIFALMHSPQLIILDEPTSNLDDEGKNSVYEIVREESQRNIVIIASNEKNDLELCNEIIYLENYKTLNTIRV